MYYPINCASVGYLHYVYWYHAYHSWHLPTQRLPHCKCIVSNAPLTLPLITRKRRRLLERLSLVVNVGGYWKKRPPFHQHQKILFIDGIIQNIPLHVQILLSHKGIYHFSIGSFPTHVLTIHAHLLIIPSYVLTIRAHVMMIPSWVKTTYIHVWA